MVSFRERQVSEFLSSITSPSEVQTQRVELLYHIWIDKRVYREGDPLDLSFLFNENKSKGSQDGNV